MGGIANDVPYDILLLILSTLQDDYISLDRSALVNHAFNRAASKFLYRRVALAPRYSLSSLRSIDDILVNSNLFSAALPQYAEHVEIIEVTRFLPTERPLSEQFSETLFETITTFKNIHTITLTPTIFREGVFSKILQYLVSRAAKPTAQVSDTQLTLRKLSVNTSCTNGEHAQALSQLNSLSMLSMYSPTRAILDLLPDWLRRLSDSLTELYLKENCGSITPGVLKSIIPLLVLNIRKISLGLSYSLTDEDVFAFLHQLPKLEKVELTFYWQLKPPTSRPGLTHLQSFAANHTNFQTRGEVRALCKWIRRAIALSPIQHLHIVQATIDHDGDGASNNAGANVSFRSIIDHLCSRHSRTLRILDMKSAYIDARSLQKLLMCCQGLEEVSLCAGSHALTILKKYGSPLTKLHTASIEIRNIKPSRRRVIDMELVTAIMKHGPPSLRRFSVNGQTWGSTWRRTKGGAFSLTIYKQPKSVFPWDRKLKPIIQSQVKAPPTVESSLINTTTSATTASSALSTILTIGKRLDNKLHVRFG